MAISGSGGWTPSVRCFIYNRQLKLGGPIHNVPKSETHSPHLALTLFIENPKAYIYVPVADDGGTVRLAELLLEEGMIDSWRPKNQ